MRKVFIIAFSVLLALSLCILNACGQETQEVEVTPEPTVDPTPTPTPTPFPEPDMKKSDYALTFEGSDVDAYEKDGIMYAKLDAIADALDLEVTQEGDAFSFPWRLSTIELASSDGLLCDGGTNLYVPVEDFCSKAQIGIFDDEEEEHLYCTPATGDWELPGGYNVPVMMYHQIGDDALGLNNTIVHADDFEEQLDYLLDNGYTPIWFSDLWNVENIEKPVILTFDDGRLDNYTVMFPIIQKYNVKVTIAPYRDEQYDNIKSQNMTEEQMKEMSDSGLVEVASHSLTHPYLSTQSVDTQYDELYESMVWITRFTGKQPTTFIYPYGDTTSLAIKMIDEDHVYRFGVMMLGYESYNTSDDPAKVYRFFPQVDTSIDDYAAWLEKSFKDK